LQGSRATEPERAPMVSIELPVNAYIPDEYIDDRTLKMSFYQRLANLERPEQVEAMAAELTDRFGAPPEPVAHLLALVRLKTEAAALGYEGISGRSGEVVFKLRKTTRIDRVALVKRFRTAALVQLGEVRLPSRVFSDEPGTLIAEMRELLPALVGAKPLAPQETASAAAAGNARPAR